MMQTLVFAQDSNPEEQAEAFYQLAIQQFGDGRYREALASFDEAIKLVPNPIFFCNRSTVLLKLKEGREALASMEICLERLEIEDPQERATLDSEVKALRVAIEGLEPTSQSIARQIATRFVMPDPPPPGGDPLSNLEVAAWTTGAIGGVSLASALVLEVLTQPLIEEYKEVARDGDDPTRFDNLKLVLEQRKLLIGALVLTGAATAITSGVLFYLHDEPEPSPETTRVGLGWTQGGAVLHLQGAF